MKLLSGELVAIGVINCTKTEKVAVCSLLSITFSAILNYGRVVYLNAQKF